MELAGDRRPGLGQGGERGNQVGLLAEVGLARTSDHDLAPSHGLACSPGPAGDSVDA